MPIHCPKCGAEHDVVEFERGRSIKCRCGHPLDILQLETVQDFLRFFENEEEREKAKIIQEEAMLICRMILNETTEDVDIEITINNLKEKVKALFPHRLEAYEMIYEARFKRLWEQFRK
jgi:hypothetical protein